MGYKASDKAPLRQSHQNLFYEMPCLLFNFLAIFRRILAVLLTYWFMAHYHQNR